MNKVGEHLCGYTKLNRYGFSGVGNKLIFSVFSTDVVNEEQAGDGSQNQRDG